MAEMNIPQKSGSRRTMSPRLDLTPMVDLGFILITFFMYTTTMAKPRVIDMNMPSKEPTPTPTVYPEESTVTLIPVKDRRVYYYFGTLQAKEQMKETTMAHVRDVLTEKKRQAAALPAAYSTDAHKLHVLMKPANSCKYEDVVQLFDEMEIVAVPYYTLADLAEQEREWIDEK